MDNNQTEIEKDETSEKQVVRHTITAEETFTLAKDVFDLRCFIKNVYNNRAVIARRLNVLTLSISTAFTLLYAAYVIFTALTTKLNLNLEIVLYSLLGVYVALFIVLLIITACSSRAKTKNLRRIKRALAVFKILVRLSSIAISIAAIVLTSVGGELEASSMALNVVIIVFSIIMLIIQVLPLLFGGLGKMVRWLLSPVNKKYRFATVALEWYELTVSGSDMGNVKKVSSRYFEDIGALIDNYLVPALGKKYINSIKPAALLNVVNRAEESDKPVLEGVLKNLFNYATERGYVTFDPCKDLNFSGSVEEEEKPPKPTMKGRLLKMGQKIGKSMLDKYINGSTEENK
ncbi:MAG: hypothetical protein HDP34_05600 [Clostridia bacterium]|nr:hypothetical protein [Clostridia bacterium]